MCEVLPTRWNSPLLFETTYGRLDAILRTLGFTVGVHEKTTRVYKHANSGALITFPIFPASQSVAAHHLVATQMTLDAFGIATPRELASQLQAS
jgi:hypothetical protein